MAKLSDTQLIILSTASQRDDHGVELPANVKGEAAGKVVDKLIRAGLLEEVRAGGALPVCDAMMHAERWRHVPERNGGDIMRTLLLGPGAATPGPIGRASHWVEQQRAGDTASLC